MTAGGEERIVTKDFLRGAAVTMATLEAAPQVERNDGLAAAAGIAVDDVACERRRELIEELAPWG